MRAPRAKHVTNTCALRPRACSLRAILPNVCPCSTPHRGPWNTMHVTSAVELQLSTPTPLWERNRNKECGTNRILPPALRQTLEPFNTSKAKQKHMCTRGAEHLVLLTNTTKSSTSIAVQWLHHIGCQSGHGSMSTRTQNNKRSPLAGAAEAADPTHPTQNSNLMLHTASTNDKHQKNPLPIEVLQIVGSQLHQAKHGALCAASLQATSIQQGPSTEVP